MIVAGVVVGALLLDDIRWTSVAGPPKRVALIQGAVPQAVKWSQAYRQPSIELYAELSEPYWGSSLLVWPETAIPAFAEEVPESVAALTSRAQKSDTALLVGMPTGQLVGDGGYFNSVVQFGNVSGRYDKRHLVPFGEYLPFDRWIRPLTTFLRIPMSNFSAGDLQQPLLSADDYKIGVSICYEDAYAGEVAHALPQANVLVNVSNDAWFGDSIAPHQHLQIARMRALETGRYLLRATNTGISAIIDERGEVVAISSQFVPDVVSGEMIPHRRVDPGRSVRRLPAAVRLRYRDRARRCRGIAPVTNRPQRTLTLRRGVRGSVIAAGSEPGLAARQSLRVRPRVSGRCVASISATSVASPL